MNQAVFEKQTLSPARNGQVPLTEGQMLAGKFSAGLWLALLGVFLGGLALNLTPCIYPLIPITVSYFCGRASQMGGNTILHGILYILGLAVTNSILGLAASLSGTLLGSILQNPFVLMGVAAILVMLALSFFGLWELKLPTGLTGLAAKQFGGYFGTFFMGLTLGIVAAPCLGPFILGLLTYVGQKGDPFLGFLYFFVLSIGMGLPLAVLAVFSGTVKRLPVSGVWMVWIRKALGWVLIGMAAYLLQPLLASPFLRQGIFGAILLAAGLHLGWLDKSETASAVFGRIKRVVGGLCIVAAFAVPLFLLHGTPGEGIQWIPYERSLLTETTKAKKPVILDFYANWCGPCKALDREVFTDPEVVKLSKNFLNMRVNLTTKHPQQKALQTRYRIRGVPTILFFDSKGKEVKPLRIESYVSANEMAERMKRLLKRK
ncbi:MAG: cytochrome c biogenesis protein CcdA [Deltaproteobacteria bacterium]